MVILIPASDYNKGENIMKHQSRFTYSLKVLFSRKLVVFAVCLVVLFVLIAVFIPVLSPYDPYKTDMTSSLLKPSSEHWLGTDKLGRDVLTRLMYGTRTSLCIGVLSVFLSSILGVAIGLISGFYGGIVNTVLSRIVDALLAIPNVCHGAEYNVFQRKYFRACTCTGNIHSPYLCKAADRTGITDKKF